MKMTLFDSDGNVVGTVDPTIKHKPNVETPDGIPCGAFTSHNNILRFGFPVHEKMLDHISLVDETFILE